MKPRLAKETDRDAVDDDGFEEEDPQQQHEETPFVEPLGTYRIAADNDPHRAAELEQEVGQLHDRVRELEREVFAARKVFRRRKRTRALTTGSIGATFGALAALILYATTDIVTAGLVLLIVGVGFVLGGLIGMRWDNPDDNFPKAPPARMY